MTNPKLGTTDTDTEDIKIKYKMAKNRRVKIVELRLIETLHHMLEQSGNFEKVRMGSFDDGSASWIDCYHKTSPNDKGKRYMKHLSFNGEGTILEDVQVWEEKMSWDDDGQKELR